MKLHWMCRAPECEAPKEGSTEYCGDHNTNGRRDKRARVKAAAKRYRPISKQSEKRAIQNEEYLEGHEEYMMLHPLCEVCGDPGTEVHHRAGRSGERLNDQSLWMTVCRPCHNEIHDNPEEARKQGYLILRSA